MDSLPTTLKKAKRPTLSLCLIAKNEEKNVNQLLDSVKDCFDEIVFVDTGSTDKTKEFAEQRGCKVFDFEWVNSFSKARNFSFSKATCDYIAWMDLDDVLKNRENFIQWRDYGMEFADLWFATYNYAIDKKKTSKDHPNGQPLIQFVRERVFKRSNNPTWNYDLHEGVTPKPEWSKSYITTWSVDHMRDEDDVKQDRSRNIKLIEDMAKDGKLDPRLQFYYGKELFEAGRATEAVIQLEKAITLPLEHHDMILSLQYGSYASAACFDQLKPEAQDERTRYFQKIVQFGTEGLKLDPNRAEFHIILADAYMRAGDIAKSVPYFHAAKGCLANHDSKYAKPVYTFKNLYGEAPTLQLAKIYIHLGLIDQARKYAEECIAIYGNEEAKGVLKEIERISSLVTLDNNQVQTEDIVFTCPPQNAYPFDEEIYKTKPLGGSETALVQMARLLREKTGRPVKVFNMRTEPLIADSGVEYLPAAKLNEYMSKNRPFVHIAWRHNIRCTNAPTYLWCHDLVTATVEQAQNFDKILCLSPFHKNYVKAMQGVPDEKIIVTRNGIDPKKFQFIRKEKDPNKCVWMSSPDRGLEQAMLVMDRVRETLPDIKLHVYYGLDNLYKYGMHALAEKLKSMMAERPWVIYHGFTEQKQMYKEVSDAVLWVHPCNFIETFCITALEMLALGVYPVTRRLGALGDTLASAESMKMATMLDHACFKDEEIEAYKNAVLEAHQEKRWENVHLDIPSFDWENVADEWIKFMGLEQAKELAG